MFVCNETCKFETPAPSSAFSEIPSESEIFGFVTHNSSVNIVAVQDVEEMNG